MPNCHYTILAGAIFDCDMLHFLKIMLLPDKQLLFKDINNHCPSRKQLLLKDNNDWITVKTTRTTAALCTLCTASVHHLIVFWVYDVITGHHHTASGHCWIAIICLWCLHSTLPQCNMLPLI